MKEILPHINKSNHSNWRTKFDDFYKIEYSKVIHDEYEKPTDGITMAEVIKCINNNSDGKSILVTDVGQYQMVACRYTKFNTSKSNVTSGGLAHGVCTTCCPWL